MVVNKIPGMTFVLIARPLWGEIDKLGSMKYK